MFREITRKNKQLSLEECIHLLTQIPRGVLSLIGDEGYPYGVPLNYWYNPQDGNLYFHSGNSGHKVDAIRKCSKASFCIMDSGYREDGDWALNIKSVIVFGKIRLVEDAEKAIEITRSLSYKYTSDTAFIEGEISKYSDGLLVFALEPEHICGKLVKES